MHRLPSSLFLVVLSVSLVAAQTPSPPQTARQALVEMFFGTASNHLEKHLPDQTRKALKGMNTVNGVSVLDQFSMISTMAKAGGAKFETFDTGPTLLEAEDPHDASKVEITVEGDSLYGDEDQIEVALHITKDGKEQVLPFIPRFTFTMKSEADIWRLNEVSATVRVQLADPDFLKMIEEQHNREAEQQGQWGIQTIIDAENSYHTSHGSYACKLADMSSQSKTASGRTYVPGLSGDIASGKHGGYIFAISSCDGNQYKVVAEPEMPGSGEHAFCADERGDVRSSADGKATTCLSSGQTVPLSELYGILPPSQPSIDTPLTQHNLEWNATIVK